MQYIDNCPNCGGKMKSVSIGWKCMGCGALLDMKHNWHLAVNDPFMPDDVLKEHDEVAGGKYRRAIERMDLFGKLFVEYKGDPRGPMGRAGEMSIAEEAQIMPVITDVDGGVWRPVQEEVLQELLKQLDYWKETCFKAAYEKQQLIEKAEKLERTLDSILSDEEKAPFDPFKVMEENPN